MNVRRGAVEALQTRLGHVFSTPELLERALTHPSVGEGGKAVPDYQRLEFLGDRVLGLLVAERLSADFPKADEGELSRRRHALVDRDSCARVGRRLDIGPALRLSPGETKSGGRDKDGILADAVEAVMAAVFLEGGLDAARAVFDRIWAEELAGGGRPRVANPKSALQEWAQGQGRPLPVYEVVGRTGPDHAPKFSVRVTVEGVEPLTAQGRSRQEAEKAAATAMLSREGLI